MRAQKRFTVRAGVLLAITLVMSLTAMVGPVAGPARATPSTPTAAPRGMTEAVTMMAGSAAVTSPAPPDGHLGLAYRHTFAADAPDATWSVVAGSLPASLSLDASTGELSGTPDEAGTFGPVTVRATWSSYLDVELGWRHTCALTHDGSIECWGKDNVGQATDQSGPFSAVATGRDHSCGILAADGSAQCWGDDTYGQATDQTGPYTAIAAGWFHTCGLLAADGSIDCWGRDNFGQAVDQSGPYTQISVGLTHSCGLLAADGSADCWGNNGFGRAADQVGPYTAVSAGSYHTCGLLAADGSADCWGRDVEGQATDQTGPYTQVSSGAWHSCGRLAADGSVDCWGLNTYGEADDQAGPATDVAAAAFHTCAVLAVDGDVDCWGDDAFGESNAPDAVIAEQTVTLTITEPAVTSAAPPDGRYGQAYTHTFGANAPGSSWWVVDGTLPDGVTLDHTTGELSGTPSEIGDFGPITVRAAWGVTDMGLATGWGHSCVLDPGGSVDCWGDMTWGQAEDRSGPYDQLYGGYANTCGILEADGSIDCWGWNFYGQGDDHIGPFLTGDVANRHACAILATDGSAQCWGEDDYGQATDQPGPFTAIATGAEVTCGILAADHSAQCWGVTPSGTTQPGPYEAITAGKYHVCAIVETDGSVDCWGQNYAGQAQDHAGPYAAVSAGFDHTCAIRAADGGVECWGSNHFGESDDQVGPYVAVSTGEYHNCAITTAGAVDCWGRDNSGQSADQPAPSSVVTIDHELSFDVLAPPQVAPVADVSIPQDGSTTIGLFVWDDDDLPADLTITVGSDDQTLVPDANLVLSGSSTVSSRVLSVTPAAGQSGTATVTITVTDPAGLSTNESFDVSVLAPAGSISGAVTTGGATPAGEVIVAAYRDDDGYTPSAYTLSAADGTYTIAGLDPGTYTLVAVPTSETGLLLTWSGDVDERAAATTSTIADTSTQLTGRDIDLLATATISGTVTSGLGPVDGATVKAFDENSTLLATATSSTGPDGTYTITGLPPGTYHVLFSTPAGDALRNEWHDDTTDRSGANPLSLTSGATLTAIDATLDWDNVITGAVTDTTAAPLAGATIKAYRDGGTYATATATSALDGTYHFEGLPAGDYELRFSAPGHVTRWWDDATTRAGATVTTVTDGSLHIWRNATLPLGP